MVKNLQELKEAIKSKKIESQFKGVEYKQSWRREHGKDLSAIANTIDIHVGWLVVGVSDNAELCDGTIAWAKETEEQVSNHIKQFLNPSWAIKAITIDEIEGSHYVAIEITNPGDVVHWNEKAYKLIGSTSHEMRADEVLELSLKLPGADYSKTLITDQYDASLVMTFAKKINESELDSFFFNLEHETPTDILSKLNIYGTRVSSILFGNTEFRFVHFDQRGDILDQKSIKGIYHLLEDTFVSEIQSWTRRQGTNVGAGSTVAREELPYPPKALREVLANAVAHALYQRDGGDIIVELHPDKLTVRNNCHLEANAFVNKWLSRYHKTYHKHLMNTLRTIKITDEQGSGKIRIFRHMLANGKREPIIDFENLQEYGRWSITLYNEESNSPLKALYTRLEEIYQNPDKASVAQALLLWRNKDWNEIKNYLDTAYQYTVNEVLSHRDTPLFVFEERIFTKRWAQIALDGQVTKEFTEAEKSQYYRVLHSFSFLSHRNGYISTEAAKAIIGLSNTKQESAQIGKLFSEWKSRNLVDKIKNGQWKFLIAPT